jgi:hypothetical protein
MLNKIFDFDSFVSRISESDSALEYKPRSFKEWLVESISLDRGEEILKRFPKHEKEKSDNPLIAEVEALSREEALETARKILIMSTMRINESFPHFRPFLTIMPPTPLFGAGSNVSAKIGTMHTTGSGIFFDPYFVVYAQKLGQKDFGDSVKSLGMKPWERIRGEHPDYSDYVTFVLIHEIMHNVLKHFLRQDFKSDWLTPYEISRLWNIATDYEINHILKRDGESREYIKMLPGGIDATAEGTDWYIDPNEVDELGNNLRTFFMESRAELIFWRLVKNIENERAKQAQDDQDGQDQGGGDQEESDDQNQESNDQGEDGDQGSGGQEESDDQNQESNDQGEDGDPGSGEGDQGESSISPGDIIWDSDNNTYGRVTNVIGDDVEYDPISEDEI